MADTMGYFKAMILIQCFFSLAITLMAYSMPAESLTYVEIFEKPAQTINIENVSNKVQASTQQSIKTPVAELGALIWFSGNVLIDLLLNFFFAIPEMIGLLFAGMNILFNFDIYILATVEAFCAALVTIMYFMGLLQLLTNIRSRGGVIQ